MGEAARTTSTFITPVPLKPFLPPWARLSACYDLGSRDVCVSSIDCRAEPTIGVALLLFDVVLDYED